MDKPDRIRLFLFASIFFFLGVSNYYLSCSIFEINESEKSIEKKGEINVEISKFRFEKEILILFGVTITCVFFFGLIAVHIRNTCMLLFYSTTGCGMFTLLLLVLYVEGVVPAISLILLTLANLSSALLSGYYAFYGDSIIYQSMNNKPYTANLI